MEPIVDTPDSMPIPATAMADAERRGTDRRLSATPMLSRYTVFWWQARARAPRRRSRQPLLRQARPGALLPRLRDHPAQHAGCVLHAALPRARRRRAQPGRSVVPRARPRGLPRGQDRRHRPLHGLPRHGLPFPRSDLGHPLRRCDLQRAARLALRALPARARLSRAARQMGRAIGGCFWIAVLLAAGGV